MALKLCNFLLVIVMGANAILFECINEYFEIANKVKIYYDNKQIYINRLNEQLIVDKLIEITANSHEMPAFGVSIDKDTRIAMKNGMWIELCFDKTMYHLDMPFDSLLINVDPDTYGFNLIRKYNNKYEGRCYYLNMDTTLEGLYNLVMDIINKKRVWKPNSFL